MEKVQQRATKMINVLEEPNTEAERMMKWELFSLKERWLGGELTEIFKLPVGYYKIKLEDQFEVSWQTRYKGCRIKHTVLTGGSGTQGSGVRRLHLETAGESLCYNTLGTQSPNVLTQPLGAGGAFLAASELRDGNWSLWAQRKQRNRQRNGVRC